MLKRRIILPTPSKSNPGSNETAVITCPGGLRYHQVLLKVTSSTGTNLPIGNWLGDIRVKYGGKVQRLHSALELNLINSANNPPEVTPGAGSPTPFSAVTIGASGTNYGQIIPIFFAEPWRNDNKQAEYFALPTTLDKLLEIEVDVMTAPAGTNPLVSISAVAIVDNGVQPGTPEGQLPVISKVFRSDLPAAVNYDLQTLDKRDLYQAIYIRAKDGSGNVVNKAILKASGTIIHELPQLENQVALAVMQTSEKFDYSLVLDADDPIQNGLPAGGLNDLQLRIENSASPTTIFRVLVQRAGAPE